VVVVVVALRRGSLP